MALSQEVAHRLPERLAHDAESKFHNGEEFWDIKDQLSEDADFATCFSGLQANGKILLLSCSTGGMKDIGTKEKPRKNGLPFDNIAQKMANVAKRVVVAPRDLAHPGLTSFLSIDDGVLYEPESFLYSFTPFYPWTGENPAL